MNDLETVEDLLDQLIDAPGGATSAADVCRDYPHLKDELERRLRAVQAVDALRLPRDSSPTEPQADDRTATSVPGTPPAELQRVGDYRVVRLLGEGGMGSVYLAEHTGLKRLDALKVMKPDLARSAQSRDRFLREAQTAAAVRHDHVVTIYHVGQADGVPYIAMELLEGESLEDRLRREPPLTTAEMLRIARETAEGLAAAHTRGLIHRDIKPSNIFLTAGGRTKILDFGLAQPVEGDGQVTQAGAVVGSPAFMSPEQAAGQELDARSDLFSLGIVLYRMTAGKLPFWGENTLVILRKIDTHSPPPPAEAQPGVPQALSALVMRLLAKSPADRPASAAEVVQALRQIEAGVDVAAPTQTFVTAAAPPRRKRTMGCSVAVTVSISLALLVAVSAVGLPRLLKPRAVLATAVASAAADPGSVPHFHALPSSKAPLKGYIDIRVRDDKDRPETEKRINREENVPLRPGQWMRIDMELNRPAYIYVVWLDTTGQAVPLYPWQDEDWAQRPAEEAPRTRLGLPEDVAKWAPLGGGPPGVESLLLLVRETPLPAADADRLRAMFADLPRQPPGMDVKVAGWFENGEVVRREVDRGSVKLGRAEASDHPINRTQSLLRSRLTELFPYTRAVCFGNAGDQ